MFEKLKSLEERYNELTMMLASPEIASDRDKFREVAKEQSDLEPIVKCYHELTSVKSEIADASELVENSADDEMRELAGAELSELEERKEKLEQQLVVLLLPKDERDDKNIIFELRAGTGGDESALFASDLFSMYTRYAEKQGWKVAILSSSESSVGGFKEVVAEVRGKGAFSAFKYERGVHRVQRVPQTETQGRVHTSTVTVAVLAEVEDVAISIEEKDLRVDVFRASGPGGQSVNTTDSAVRITHVPTGLVVTCQDEKSQFKNKAKAMTVLRARLFDLKQSEVDAERSADRKGQIGTGERSEKIRTYNFPQGRVTDHRIGLTIYQLDTFLGGELDLVVEPLRVHFQTEALKGESGGASGVV